MSAADFSLLDTRVGDRLLNSAAIAAILAANVVAVNLGAVTAASVASAGAVTGASVTVTGNVSGLFVQGSVGNTLTATGTTRANALALTKAINNLTTVATNTGAILPDPVTVGEGGSVVIFNAGASAAQIYAPGSTTIDGVAGATGVALTNAKRCIYYVIGGVYVSAQLGVVSA